MGERDPRVDPVRGDQLRHSDSERRLGVSGTNMERPPGYVYFVMLDGERDLGSASLDEWRTWAKTATVLGHGDANG